MSMITEPLRHEIFVHGEAVGIKTDFRVWLKFGEILKSGESFWNKLADAVLLCVEPSAKLPADAGMLFLSLTEFYLGKLPKPSDSACKKRVMDTEADADYIFAAFYQQYGIDLTVERLHWQKFRALLSGLSDDTCFMRIVRIRAGAETGRDSAELKRLYALPISSDSEAAEALSEAF